MGEPHTVLSGRRTVLQLIGLAAGASGVPTALGHAQTFVLEQDGRCVPVTPLTGTQPVEDLYEYRFPTDRFDAPSGSDGSTFSSHGTTDLQRDGTSIVFLYDGPRGLSLVIVHGRLEGDGPGGTVRFTVRGVPAGGEWVVRDDDYFVDGEQAPSNFDRWNLDGEVHTIDWVYRGGRTDGGAFRGLGSDFEVRIDPAFNDEAPLSEDHDFGPVEAWEVLSGDREPPARHSLRLDRPVTIRQGECPSDGARRGDGEGRIAGLSVADGVFTTGEEVPADVSVENTGDRDHTFFVGYSVIGPDGKPRHNDGTTDEPHTVQAGDTRTKTVTWTVEGDAPDGSYDAKVALWRTREGDDLQTRLDSRRVESAFEVVTDDVDGDADGRITDLRVADGVFTTDEEVPATVTVENTGDRDHTFFVGYSAIDPDGGTHHDDGTTDEPVTIPAGESKTKTVTWTVERGVPVGSYDAKVALWRTREGDDLQTRLDFRRIESAFQVTD